MVDLRFRMLDGLLLLIVLTVGGGARAWYVGSCAGNGPAPLEVQGPYPLLDYPAGPKSETTALVENMAESRWFGSRAPLADKEEKTAHRAPGYHWLAAVLIGWLDNGRPPVADAAGSQAIRWAQVVLGTLTGACYFFFARRAFRSLLVGFLAGLLAALHPFWVLNTAELTDGVLATFLLAVCLMLGCRGSQVGGPITSLLFGLSAAGLAMVRAALLPFAVVAVLWFLFRCRKINKGWFAALLAFLGFGNGLAPWAVRNFQEFEQPVPVADSALLHLWIGNCRLGTGGPMTEATLRKSLPPDRLRELLAETNQARRYAMLGRDLPAEIAQDSAGTLQRRLWAGLYFVFGEDWFKKGTFYRRAQDTAPAEQVAVPEWLSQLAPIWLPGTLLGMLVLGLLGWRWSYGWRKTARLATIAAILGPLPYLLSHADHLSGPRLPLDGVWLCFSAFAIACMVPGIGRSLLKGPQGSDAKNKKETAGGSP